MNELELNVMGQFSEVSIIRWGLNEGIKLVCKTLCWLTMHFYILIHSADLHQGQ